MDVLFIQKQGFSYFGIMSMAGYLQKHGHATDCLIDNLEPAHEQKEELSRADIIGISVLSTEHWWLIDVIQRIRSIVPDTPIVIGGIHAILYPEILQEAQADMLCAGEGETTLKKLLDNIGIDKRSPNLSDIEGLAYKKDGKIEKNRMPKLLQCFDWLEDRSVYYKRYKTLKNERQKQFMSGRGCPYKCNFCFNAQLMEKYRGLGKYVRKKPVDLFIEEIERTKAEHGAESIYFSDDTFVINREWLFDFLNAYRKRIKSLFMCTVRADLIDEEIARELSLSGCHTISMGVETGNEKIRTITLNKNIGNKALKRAARYFRENSIRIQTSSMFGIPGETVDDALETVRFNIELGATFAFSAMLMPFPGTGIEKKALELGWLDRPLRFEMLPQSFFSHSVFKAPEIEILENVKSVAHWCVAYPKRYGIFEKLVRLRCRPLFSLLDKLGIFFRYKGERKLGLLQAVRMFWRFRKSR